MTVALQVQLVGWGRVRQILSNLSRAKLSDLMDNVGNLVANQTRRRISHDKTDPTGTPWAPLSPAYARAKALEKPNAGILEFEGDLRDSITHVVRSKVVEIGSNLPYARVHQEGSRDGSTPARPYLGLGRQDEDDVEEAVVVWLRRVMGVTV